MEKFKSFMIQVVLYPIVFNSLFAKLVFLFYYYYYYYYYFGGGGLTELWDKKLNLNCQTKRKSIYFWNSNSKTLKILEFNLQSVRTRNDHQNKERRNWIKKSTLPDLLGQEMVTKHWLWYYGVLEHRVFLFLQKFVVKFSINHFSTTYRMRIHVY